MFTFRFSDPVGSDSGAQWDALYGDFSRAIMKSPGGVVASGCTYGWSLDRESFCGAFRYLNRDSMESFLGGGEGRVLMEALRSRASAGVEVEYLDTRKFDRGWHGSVDKTLPDNPRLEALFRGITGEMSRVMRGVQ